MISKRLFIPLAVVLAFGLIAAGCGGGDDTSSDSVATTTQATDTTGGGGGGGATGGSTNPSVQAAVDACKQSVQAAGATLSASTVSDLNKLCEDAGSGSVQKAQQASEQVCEEIVKDTVPAGSAQDSAISACKSAAP